ncbi:MAG: DMT family transporter [Burkholderiales bacterium]|nr:DMT family transporter [Burkholderiales bacterium]
MDTRKPVGAQAIATMLLLCAVWGFQQVALKGTAALISPMLQIGLRSGVAALLVALLMLARGEPLSVRDGSWRPGLVIGFLFALEFLFVAEALRFTSASHVVVFLYTAPIFAALGLHWRLPAERLRPLQWAGIGLAFAGIALAFFGSARPAGGGASTLLGDLLASLGGAAWGATTVVVRATRLSALTATRTLLYQLLGAFVLLVAAAALLGQNRFESTPISWVEMGFQAVVISFASFLTWFSLLRRYQASQLGVFSFMTPMFGVAFGVWLLGEPLEVAFVGGSVLVLAGLLLVTSPGWIGRAAGRLQVSSGA